jgi:Zn-finger nucleic acid-binding protein
MFAGATFCAKCGTARDRGEAPSENARCPVCEGPFQRVDVGKTTFLECTACDGAWIDATTFEALCADSEAQAAVLHRYAGRSDVAPGPVKYRCCLRCGKMMNRVNFGRLSGAVVDVCRGHGTYLDVGELHQIVSFIRGGGIERARRRQLEEMRQEKRDLEALETRVRAREATTARNPNWTEHSFLDFITLLGSNVDR